VGSPPTRLRLASASYTAIRVSQVENCASLKLIQMPVSVEIGLLHGILGFGVILQNCACSSIEALIVASHEDFEHFNLPSRNPIHDFFIGENERRRSPG
jgi:hypothetical protein